MRCQALAIAALTLLPGAVGAQTRSDDLSIEQAFVGALQQCGEGWARVPALQEALVSLGSEVIPLAFDVLVDESFRAADEATQLRLDKPRQFALTSALGILPRELLRARLEQVARASSSERERLVALALIERFGTAEEFQLASRVAGIHLSLVTPALELAFRAGIESILQREPKALFDFAKLLKPLHPKLFVPATGAIAALGSRTAFEVLCQALCGDLDMDPVLLLRLRRLGPKLPIPPHPKVLEPVRRSLSSKDSTTVILAASILMDLEDTSSVPLLIDALRGADANSCSALRLALKRLTHVNLGNDAENWNAWYQVQEEWFVRWADRSALEVENPSVIISSKAIQALSSQPVFAEEMTLRLLPGLRRREPSLVSMTCAALGQMGCWSAVPGLLAVLEHPNPKNREAARDALVRITDLELPPDAASWRFRLQHMETKR